MRATIYFDETPLATLDLAPDGSVLCDPPEAMDWIERFTVWGRAEKRDLTVADGAAYLAALPEALRRNSRASATFEE